jgi:hypothetical protein
MAVSRDNVPPPLPPMEAVEVAGIGEVIVRGAMGRDRLALAAADSDGEVYDRVSALLAVTVVDGAHKPIYSADQWDAYSAGQFDEWLRLFGIAQRLSGMAPEAAAKK